MIFIYNSRTSSKKRQQGVTLLEMLIAMAIIAILLTVVSPNIQTILNKNRITADINEMSAIIQYARFSAIDQNTATVVCPSSNFATCSTDWNQPKIVFIDSNDNGDRDAGEELIRSTEATSAQQYFTGPASSLEFTDSGATNMIATFKLCPLSNDMDIARAVNVNQQGRTRISTDSDNDGIHEDANGTNLVCT